MGGLELAAWVAVGLAVGGAYSFAMRSQHFGVAVPLLMGAMGAFTASWLTVLVSPDRWEETFRPGLLIVAFVGAGLFVLGYHVYRMGATPRTQ